MDLITKTIVVAVSAGVTKGITADVNKSIVDAYNELKSIISSKFGKDNKVSKAIAKLEEEPDSKERQTFLLEQVGATKADQDSDILEIANKLGIALWSTEAGRNAIGKFAMAEEPQRPEWYEVLQEELDRLPVGKVVFNPPDTMKLGVKERVETRISRDINANLMTSLRGRGLPHIEELIISELMKVRLSGDDFHIISLNEEEQIVEASGFTEWAWDVTPRKSGNKILHLHVTLRIGTPFGIERKDHPVLDREIVVQVNPAYSVKSFVVSYWKWIVTALILPLIGWVWKTYIK